ncbi:pyridoxamine 5'-phosphate oxidase family protein [Streptomyces sp. NBC_00893]|uniref:pyridoxamine 5'-phosphate oxidase family protein n=1 Tax=Streptomyces sp. NBC_00893 TaxID=2975862 RepID=UPI00224E0B22|nr:pyridoxamine 5'-phosphate oxidase family protein [Streptomyces sp. NBC_00893]MCX4848600.1 pyridoxamine 5'-phosphate oxidase family protein [Streptomyces sp. NBC_00893]
MTSSSWEDFRSAEPDFAETVRARFQLYKHHVLATLRKDGSPRVTGLEVDFRFGEVWLGMMPDSRKALDLLRDPRFAVHANPGPDAGMADGDVRISGRAVETTDPAVLARFIEEVKPPEPFHLFRVELTEVVHTGLEGGGTMIIRTWCPGHPPRVFRKGNDDGSPSETT